MKTIRNWRRIANGFAQVVHRVIHTGVHMWPFKSRAVQVREVTNRDVLDSLQKLRTDLELLTEAHELLRAQHTALRGRVYALWGKEKPGEQPAPTTPETKQQARARLLAEGKLVPGKPVQHN